MKTMEEYSGPFPRGKHSHKCLACVSRGQGRVACYKAKCRLASVTEDCSCCRKYPVELSREFAAKPYFTGGMA